jgi:tRNA U34 5-methylaminomethyl-2-thiouridine-forming methyltransferase MnmC
VKREIIRTEDGSTTIRLADWDECYHSKHGAIQEAYHVFIKNGLSLYEGKPVSILEIGFGTGLNAFITFLESGRYDRIDYVGIEAYPVSLEEAALMNYASELESGKYEFIFKNMHEAEWEMPFALSENFKLTKRKILFDDIEYTNQFDLIYFDAFGFRVQPELWSAEIFKRMFAALKPKGVLVTYAARGIIKRNMQEAGFTVAKLPGPPGKREMMRALKNN